MTGLTVPLHVGRLNGRPLRFFRSPLLGTQLPWHAWDDLHACLDVPEALRLDLNRGVMADWAGDVRTVATREGIVTIAPHWMAQGIVAAIGERDGPDPALVVAYQQALFSAWSVLTGDMPAADAIVLLGVAIGNMLAEQGRRS